MKIRDFLTGFEIETDDLELMWQSNNVALSMHNGGSREVNSKVYFTGNLYFFVKKMIERNTNNETIEQIERIKPICYDNEILWLKGVKNYV